MSLKRVRISATMAVTILLSGCSHYQHSSYHSSQLTVPTQSVQVLQTQAVTLTASQALPTTKKTIIYRVY